jgi:hypothetical protein
MSHLSFAQIAVSYYPFHPSQLSFCSNPEKLLWADLRLETNTFLSNLNIELSPMINFKRTEKANFYGGAGISFNPSMMVVDQPYFNGYFIDLGARIKPFREFRQVHVIFEISPYCNSSLSGGNLRARLGLGYNFIRKQKTE